MKVALTTALSVIRKVFRVKVRCLRKRMLLTPAKLQKGLLRQMRAKLPFSEEALLQLKENTC